MKNKIRIGIVGGAGYTGGELIRLLLHHPAAELRYIHSKSHAGKGIHSVHQDLAGATDLSFTAEMNEEVDVLFLCVGHGDSRKFLEASEVAPQTRVISLSQDFRLKKQSVFNGRQFVYGLPEVYRDDIKNAQNIANPGCFATAIELGLLPLAQMHLLHEVFTTGITGSTGAGQSFSGTSHFSWRENNIQAYKTLTHQHLGEIVETLGNLSGDGTASVHFVPWRGDFTRGIFVTSQVKCVKPLAEVYDAYRQFYKDHPFVVVSEEPIFLKQVVNTNNCFIHLEMEQDILVIHSAIDNLLKGASGQAVENMNLLFGLAETEGLKLKANYF